MGYFLNEGFENHYIIPEEEDYIGSDGEIVPKSFSFSL